MTRILLLYKLDCPDWKFSTKTPFNSSHEKWLHSQVWSLIQFFYRMKFFIIELKRSQINAFSKDLLLFWNHLPSSLQTVDKKLTNPYDVKTSGDARRALDICRRAAELAQRDVINGNVVATKSPRKTPSKKNLSSNSLVQLKHVNLAHQVNSIQMWVKVH